MWQGATVSSWRAIIVGIRRPRDKLERQVCVEWTCACCYVALALDPRIVHRQ